jgi:hypothetical protein
MAAPNSLESLIDYSFRRLGAPVVDINVEYQQAVDRVNDALDYFSERHFDGVEKHFYAHKLSAADRTNGYIDTSGLTAGSAAGYTGAPAGNKIVSVIKVLPFGGQANGMFGVKYQMALNDYFGINRASHMGSSMGLAGYDSTKRFINMIEQMFNPEKSIRFSKVSNRIYIDMDWSADTETGDYLLIEAYAKLDPDTFTEIYNDRYLKEYVTALIKRQWGQNLSKFEGVQMVGGVSFRGVEIFQEANEEIQRIEERMLLEYELPIDFMIG